MNELERQVNSYRLRRHPGATLTEVYKKLLEEVGELGEAIALSYENGNLTNVRMEAADCGLCLTILLQVAAKNDLLSPIASLQQMMEAKANINDQRLHSGQRKPDRPKVVTLCGSTKFKEEFLEAQRYWGMEHGCVVLTITAFTHSDGGGVPEDVLGEDLKSRLDALHLRKIDMSDFIYVVSRGGYIGNSTFKEITYALSQGKEVRWLEEMTKESYWTRVNVQKRLRPTS